MFGRTKIAMVVAEFFGAGLLTLGVLSAGKSGVGFSLFIAGTVGFLLALLIVAVGHVTEAHFNPAVALGLWTARKTTTSRAVAAIAAQFAGAYAASALYVYLVDQKLRNVADKQFNWRVLVAELVGTLVFSFGVAAAVYKGLRGVRWAVTVGAALFAGVVVASIASNGLANPAVALGVDSWSKSYVIGPLVGGILGVNLYGLLFAPAESLVAVPAAAKAEEAVAVARAKSSARRKTTAKKTTTKRATTRSRR